MKKDTRIERTTFRGTHPEHANGGSGYLLQQVRKRLTGKKKKKIEVGL